MEKLGEKKEQTIEEVDSDLLDELNQLSKKLKTDEEIIKDYHTLKNQENIKKDKNDGMGEKIDQNSKNIENPFKEGFNILNIQNIEGNDLMFQSLDSLNSKINQFNSVLNNTLKQNMNQGDINKKENNILSEILDFLIQSNLLKDTILNMKKSIEDSLQKNKNELKKEELQKYEEALINADNILNETNKINSDREKIMDSLQKLQHISNEIDSIFLF